MTESKKKERKAIEIPIIIQFVDKTWKIVTFTYIPKVNGKFKLDDQEYRVKRYDGPICCVVKVKQLTEEEVKAKEKKRFEEAEKLFTDGQPLALPTEKIDEDEEALVLSSLNYNWTTSLLAVDKQCLY